MEIAEQTRRANLMNARDSLRVFEGRLAELRRCGGRPGRAEDAGRRPQRVRADEDPRRAQETLNQIKMQIEKYRIMVKDPDTPKVQSSAGPRNRWRW